jgi:general secretion pathway protein K
MISLKSNRKLAQQGVALITVMLIVALASVLAMQMTTRLHLQMQRTSNISFNQQAYWYAMGAEAFAQRVLMTSFEKETKVTHLSQDWAMGEMSYPVDYGTITGEISDLHTCLNLNALRMGASKEPTANSGSGAKAVNSTKLPARAAFEELLTSLNIEGVGQFEAESMADALTDWLDQDSGLSGVGGAEDNDYASKTFPYLAANHYLASINELRIIEHFTVPIINALKDYACVLPMNNLHQININTLDAEKPELLQALLDISLEDATKILTDRDSEGFKDIQDLFALPELSKVTLTEPQKKQFVVDSEYFSLKTTASFNDSYFSMYSTLMVDSNEEVQVVRRTIGK